MSILDFMPTVERAQAKQKIARFKTWGWSSCGVPLAEELRSNGERLRQCRAYLNFVISRYRSTPR